MLAMICVFYLLASGCAGQRTVSLGYQPVGSQKAAAPIRVAVVKFTDRRTDKTMGEIAGGFGTQTVLVLPASQDAGQWVTDAMVAELSQAGLQATQAIGAIPPSITIRITGNVLEIHARINDGIRATAKVDIIVTNSGMMVLAKQYTGQTSVKASSAPSADDYRRSLESAMQDAMKKATSDILATIQ
jgi:hypothetical protein